MSLFRNFLNPKSKSDKGQDKPETSDRSKYMPDVKSPTDERFMLNFKNNGGKFLYCETNEEVMEVFDNILLEFCRCGVRAGMRHVYMKLWCFFQHPGGKYNKKISLYTVPVHFPKAAYNCFDY